MLGVLGGMGPLATVDFFGKLVSETKSINDQGHIPTIIWSVPQIPDRSSYIMNNGESPYPELRKGILALQTMGASVVAMPCNTAHYWSEQLTNNTGVKILHIVDAVLDSLETSLASYGNRKVGLLGTTGTVESNVYQKKCNSRGFQLISPDEQDQKQVMQAIHLVKSGCTDEAKNIFLTQISRLKNKGANSVILGCTEIPSVLDSASDLIDCNEALASRCVKWFQSTIGKF